MPYGTLAVAIARPGGLHHHLDRAPLLPLVAAEARRTDYERAAPVSDALYIIAKAPRVGLAKTRLGRAIGDEAAIVLYKAFLRDLAARFADAPFECGWYLTLPDAWDDISPLVGPGREARVLFQKEGDLTERQR